MSIRAIYTGVCLECERSVFSQTEWSDDLTSRLDEVASLSRELTAWPDWKFCPVVLQLAWLFSSSVCFTRVPALVTCQSRDPVARPCWVHTLEHFFTLSHTLPLHESHLNMGFLNSELQANLAWNKANKMVDWIQPYNKKITNKGNASMQSRGVGRGRRINKRGKKWKQLLLVQVIM